MKLVYKNLVIRKAVAADADQLWAWWGDGKIMAQFGLPNGIKRPPEEIRIDDCEQEQGIDNYHIIELDGKPIGEMNYGNFSLAERCVTRLTERF